MRNRRKIGPVRFEQQPVSGGLEDRMVELPFLKVTMPLNDT